MKDFLGTEINVNDNVAFTNPLFSRGLFALGKVTAISKSFVEVEYENPYFDGDIYPDKYKYIKKRPENVIIVG